MNRRPLDEHAFDELDDMKSYLLGFLWADGCLTRTTTSSTLDFQITDKGPVKRLRKTLKSGHALIERRRPEPWSTTYRLSCSGLTHLSERLRELGMKDGNKEENRFPPEIPPKLFPSFIRGFLDGDGSVGIYKNGDSWILRTTFTGTYRMLSWVQKTLRTYDISGILAATDRSKYGQDEQWSLVYASTASLKLERILYNRAGYYLRRKQRRFEDFRRYYYMRVKFISA